MGDAAPDKLRHRVILPTVLVIPFHTFLLWGLEGKVSLYIPGTVPGTQKVLNKPIMNE